MNKKIIVWILVFIILTSTALALGIRPAKTTINFGPNLEKEYFFNIVNNEKGPLEIEIKVEGSLKHFIELNEKEISISEEEEFRSVKFKVNLPEFLTPGLNIGDIIITEKVGEEGMIRANLELTHKVRIIAPYPEKYVDVDIQLRMRETESDIITEVKNSGSEKINQLTTKIEVYDNKKSISELHTEPISLEPTQTKQYYLTLNHTILSEGEYDILAKVNYDTEELEITRKLLVGEPKIKIFNLDEFFLENEINDLRLELKNQWNKEIENIHAEILVQRDNKEVYSSKTVSFNLKGNQQKVIKTFLDLTELGVGKADLYITLNYQSKSEKVHYEVDIFSVDIFEERIKEVQIISGPSNTLTMIVILIMSLTIFGMLLLVFIPKIISKLKKESTPPEYIKSETLPKERPKPQQSIIQPKPKPKPPQPKAQKIPEDDILSPEDRI